MVCLEREAPEVTLPDPDPAAFPGPVLDPGEGLKGSESEWDRDEGEDGIAGLLSNLFISTEPTDVPPSDTFPDEVCGLW
jgi:hypothetical protein